MSGEDISLSGQTLFAAGQKTLGHIPHIHEVITAGYPGRKPAGKPHLNHLNDVVASVIIGADDSGGMYNHGIKAILCGIPSPPDLPPPWWKHTRLSLLPW